MSVTVIHLRQVVEREAPRIAFRSSIEPILICDAERRCIDANAAACLLLRMAREVILEYRIDDLVQPEALAQIEVMWPAGQAVGHRVPLRAITCELRPADGARVPATLYVGAFECDRMLVIIDFPPVRTLLDGISKGEWRSHSRLTPREREVLALVAEGKTGLAIAAELYLAPTTVQTHVNNALIKLGAKNRSHGIAIAIRSGELELDDA